MASANDLVLLTLTLAQLKSTSQIKKIFVEALQNLWPDFRFSYEQDAPSEGFAAPIVTANRAFGNFVIQGDLDDFRTDEYALIRNAVTILAVLLDKCELERLVAVESRKSDHDAHRRAEDAWKANRALEELNKTLEAEIAERKRAEQERDRLFKYSLDMMVITDFNGNFRQVSPSWSKTLGWSHKDLMSATLFDLVHPEDRAATVAVSERLRIGEDIRFFENRIALKSGGYRVLSWSAHSLKDESLVFSVARDITESKSMQDRLRQSERLEAVGQLAAGIAHDFNNQLAGIMGYADLIREDVAEDSRLRRYTDNIIVSVKRASDLTQQLLAFARKGKYLSIPIDLRRIVFEVVSLLRHSIDKRIHIRQQLEADFAVTCGDPSQVQNAILNLALNARDAMPQGGVLTFVTDTVTYKQEASSDEPLLELDNGDYVRVQVIDTGTGMTPEVQEHMFEPFFTTKGEARGAGMGLAAVYGTVKHHKGGIHVASSPGAGTTISLFFPLEQQMPRVSEKQVEILEGTAHILLIDDEPGVCTVGADILKRLGYRATIHQDSIGAVEYFRRSWRSVDLVILDLVMPRMGGKEVFAELTAVDPDVKVIISSGYSIEGEAQELLNQGAVDFVQKPFRIGVLSQKIAGVLQSA